MAADEGRVPILIIRVQVAGAGEHGRPQHAYPPAAGHPTGGRLSLRARVTWLTDINDPGSQVIMHAVSRGAVIQVLRRWLDSIGIPEDARSPSQAGPGP